MSIIEQFTTSSPEVEQRMRLWFICTEFLNYEAQCLDDNEMDAWVGLLDPDVDYRVPIRITRERTAGMGFSEHGSFIHGDFEHMKLRCDRLKTDFAWAEDPPSRARRLVSNVRVGQCDDEFIHVRSDFLLYRSRYDSVEYGILTGDRHDVLHVTADGLRLYRRTAYIDHATLGIDNLALIV